MVRWLLYNLFYPWWSAHYWAAYQLYTESVAYKKIKKHRGVKVCLERFPIYMQEYLTLAAKEKWVEIIFSPWKFSVHEDYIGE